MKCVFDGVNIEAVSCSVPQNLIEVDGSFIGADDESAEKIKKITGIDRVAISDYNVTASDLCFDAARLLSDRLPAFRNGLDALLFVSQSRDYIMPTTSSTLQHRLGFSKSVLALDIPSGCAGYIHGLFVGGALIASGVAQRILLLCGETNSKLISRTDYTVSTIFGDAGSATLLSKKEGSKLYFNLNTDGAGYDKIIIRDGGCRSPVTKKSIEPLPFENGNIRRAIDMEMDGLAVLNFALTEVPLTVSQSLEDCGLSASEVDLFVAHQANKLIVEKLAKKCGFSKEKGPFLAQNVGNSGPASIPLALCEGFSQSTTQLKNVVLCGFGVGLNWGVCIGDLSQAKIFASKKFDPVCREV